MPTLRILVFAGLAPLLGCAAAPVEKNAADIAWAGEQRTANPPAFSPDSNRYLVTIPPGSANVLEIWRRQENGAELEWAYSWEEAGIASPATIAAIIPDWKYPGRIDLRFSDAIRTRWTGTITQDEEGWHLRTGKITISP